MRTNRQRLDVDHKINRLHHVRSHRGKVLRLAQKHCSDSSFNPEKTLKLSVKNCDLTLTHPKKALNTSVETGISTSVCFLQFGTTF